jgi:carbonic anhydrase
MLTEFIDAVVVCGHIQGGGVEAGWLLAQGIPAVPEGTPLHRWLPPIVVTAKALRLNKPPYLEQKERAFRILTSVNTREQVSLGFLVDLWW